MSKLRLLGFIFREQYAASPKPKRRPRVTVESLETREMPSINWGEVGLIGTIFDKMNEKVWLIMPGQAATASKAQFFKSAIKSTVLYLLPRYVLPIGVPVLELYAVDPYMEAIGKRSMSGPVDSEPAEPFDLFGKLWNSLASIVPVAI